MVKIPRQVVMQVAKIFSLSISRERRRERGHNVSLPNGSPSVSRNSRYQARYIADIPRDFFMLCAPSPNLVFWKVSVQKYKDFSVKKSDKFSSWPLKILSQEFWNPHCQYIFKKSVTVCVAGRGLWLHSQEFGSLIKSLNAAPHVFFSKNEAHRFLEFCTKTAMDRKFNQIRASHFSEVRPSVWNPPWPKPCDGLSPNKGFTGLLTVSSFFI